MNENIFLIDDFYVMLEMLKEQFEQNGYTNVNIFDNPLVALDKIKSGTKPSIVISDYNMPEMNGFDLLCEVEKFHPDTKCLLMTAEKSKIESDKFSVIEKGNISDFFWSLEKHIKELLPA